MQKNIEDFVAKEFFRNAHHERRQYFHEMGSFSLYLVLFGTSEKYDDQVQDLVQNGL